MGKKASEYNGQLIEKMMILNTGSQAYEPSGDHRLLGELDHCFLVYRKLR